MDKLPTIAFTLAGKDFTLEPEFYVLKIKDDASGKYECQLGMQAMDQLGLWILGDPFLRKYYTPDAVFICKRFAMQLLHPARKSQESPLLHRLCALLTAHLVRCNVPLARSG